MVKTSSSANPSLTHAKATNIVSAAKGSGVVFMGRLFEYAGRFLLGVMLARFMGAGQYGIYALADTMLTLITGIALLGLSQGMVYYIPFFKNIGDKASLWGTLFIGLAIPFAVSVWLSIALIILGKPIATWLDKPTLVSVMPIVAIAVPFSVLMFAAAQATQAFRRMRFKVIAQDIVMTSVKIICVALFAIYYSFHLNATLALVAHTIGVLVACGMLFYYLHTELFSLNRSLKSAHIHFKLIFSFSLPVYFSQLINTFGNEFQTLMLGVLSTSSAVGIFTAASRTSTIGKMFQASIVTVAMPYVSDLHSRHEFEQLNHFYQTVTKWTYTVNLPVFLMMLLFSKPILMIFGDSFVSNLTIDLFGVTYSAGAVAMFILAFGHLIDAGTGICGVIITMNARPWLNTFNSMLAFSSTILLNILLIPTWGVIGAATAQVASVTILNVTRIIQAYLLYDMQPYNRSFIKPTIAGLVAFAATFILDSLIFTNIELIGTILNIIFLFAVYIATIIALGLDADDRMIINRVAGKLKPK